MRDKREYFYKQDWLTPAQEQENELLISAICKANGIPYTPPKVKLVKKDTTIFHPWPCECHPNRVTKETV